MIYVVVTTVKSFPDNFKSDAIDFALKMRQEGKRSEIISAKEFTDKYMDNQQDLTKV